MKYVVSNSLYMYTGFKKEDSYAGIFPPVTGCENCLFTIENMEWKSRILCTVLWTLPKYTTTNYLWMIVIFAIWSNGLL